MGSPTSPTKVAASAAAPALSSPTAAASGSSRSVLRPLETITPAAAGNSNSTKSLSATEQMEQYIFEQCLTADPYGVAIRKISHHGKAHLRFVKCVYWSRSHAATTTTSARSTTQDEDHEDSSQQEAAASAVATPGAMRLNRPTPTRSLSSRSNGSWGQRQAVASPPGQQRRRVSLSSSTGMASESTVNPTSRPATGSGYYLIWGKRKDIMVPLSKFVAVQMGKTTPRTMRNASPANRLLSLVTSENSLVLDIEAPTCVDRDKFARAFAKFLHVPLRAEGTRTGGVLIPNPRSSVAAIRPNTAIPSLVSLEATEPVEARQVMAPSPPPAPPAAMAPLRPAASSPTATAPLRKQQQQPISPPGRSSTTGSRGGSSRGSGGPPPLAPSNRDTQAAAAAVQASSSRVLKPPPLRTHQSLPPPSAAAAAAPAATTASTGTPPTYHDSSSSQGGVVDESSMVSNSQGERRHHDSPTHPISAVATKSEASPRVEEEKKEDRLQHKTSFSSTQTLPELPSPKSPHRHSPTATAAPTTPPPARPASPPLHSPVLATTSPDAAVIGGGTGEQDEVASNVSSLTGHGDDQEVEELYQIIADLRTELEQCRAEAARAVKVAEQAIQSAERAASGTSSAPGTPVPAASPTTTMDAWQNTVTYQAAAAAAQAQKRSAEAMAAQRVAEQRLESEKRSVSFWRRQAAVAEAEAGVLQTRAAAAEVQRQALAERLSTVQRRNQAIDTTLPVLPALFQQLEANGETQESTLARSPQRHSQPSSGTSPPRDPIDHLSLLQSAAENVDFSSLPPEVRQLTLHLCATLQESQSDGRELQARLAMESAARRKLLYEVQDLRGTARVYCRIRPGRGTSTNTERSEQNLFSLPSQETLMLHRDHEVSVREEKSDYLDGLDDHLTRPLTFDFDRVFDESISQSEVYNEVEEVCLGVLDGYRICVIAYGQSGAGKTHSILGQVVYPPGFSIDGDPAVDIENEGLQLQAMKHLFAVAQNRCDRYKDTFTLTIVEVQEEKLVDLLSGTGSGAKRGRIVQAESSRSSSRRRSLRNKIGEDDASSERLNKLEIRTDLHGDTTVQGALGVEVESYEDVLSIWLECLEHRRHRLIELGFDLHSHESSSHVIATLKVTSANIATGHGSCGRIQFVDLAGADVVERGSVAAGTGSVAPMSPSAASHDGILMSPVGSIGYSDLDEYRFQHRSLETFSEVVTARSQFLRSVPYRNSTLTHLLRDSLEADTKVILLACVSPDPTDLQATAATLRFASRMRKVNIGKATKHTMGPP
jgi:kinesin family member C2/C3